MLLSNLICKPFILTFILFQISFPAFAQNLYFFNEQSRQSYIQSNIWQISISDKTGLGFSVQSEGTTGILTAFHVIQSILSTGDIKDIVLLNKKTNQTKRIKSFYFDAVNDLVLIEPTEENEGKGLPIGAEPPSKNKKIFLFGYSSSDNTIKEMHSISPIVHEEVGHFYSFYVNRDNRLPGASGGPVFNKRGQVIGVFTQGISNHVSEVIGLRNLNNFIKKCNNYAASRCIKEEVENIKRLAEEGDLRAQAKLGDMLYYGRGMARDKEEAMKWYKASHEKSNEYGRGMAAIRIGMIYIEDDNREEAEKWFRTAVKMGNPTAEFNIGALTGDKRWFQKAAQEGFIPAQEQCQSPFTE